jgi:hypothetical protein
MENLCQGSRVVGDYSLLRLGRLFRDSLGWPAEHQSPRLPVGDFSQPLVGTSAFQGAKLSGSPHQLILSRNSRCGRQRMQSPNHLEFACYWCTKVR